MLVCVWYLKREGGVAFRNLFILPWSFVVRSDSSLGSHLVVSSLLMPESATAPALRLCDMFLV